MREGRVVARVRVVSYLVATVHNAMVPRTREKCEQTIVQIFIPTSSPWHLNSTVG